MTADEYVDRLVAEAPPLTSGQRDHLAQLLTASRAEQAA